jgi:hypothetical protein
MIKKLTVSNNFSKGKLLRNRRFLKKWIIRSQAPNLIMIRVWRRFNDYMVLGPIDLANLNDGLRYSLDPQS